MVYTPRISEEEKLSVRITFHTKPSVDERLNRIVAKSALDRPDWLRRWLEIKLSEIEADEMAEGDVSVEEVSNEPLAVQLAAANARIAGLEEVNGLLRERIGMADAHSVDLSQKLESSLMTFRHFSLALPSEELKENERRAFSVWLFGRFLRKNREKHEEGDEGRFRRAS